MVRSGVRTSPNCMLNKEKPEHLIPIHKIEKELDIPCINGDSMIVDGLFGSGLNRPISGIYCDIIGCINESGAVIYSIDIPSGLFTDNNIAISEHNVIKADEVFTIQFPKISLLLPESGLFFIKR